MKWSDVKQNTKLNNKTQSKTKWQNVKKQNKIKQNTKQKAKQNTL